MLWTKRWIFGHEVDHESVVKTRRRGSEEGGGVVRKIGKKRVEGRWISGGKQVPVTQNSAAQEVTEINKRSNIAVIHG